MYKLALLLFLLGSLVFPAFSSTVTTYTDQQQFNLASRAATNGQATTVFTETFANNQVSTPLSFTTCSYGCRFAGDGVIENDEWVDSVGKHASLNPASGQYSLYDYTTLNILTNAVGVGFDLTAGAGTYGGFEMLVNTSDGASTLLAPFGNNVSNGNVPYYSAPYSGYFGIVSTGVDIGSIEFIQGDNRFTLDNISVIDPSTATPEPATAVLGLVGLSFLGTGLLRNKDRCDK